MPIVNEQLPDMRTGGVVGFYWNSYSKYADLKMLKNMENLETFKLKRTVLQGVYELEAQLQDSERRRCVLTPCALRDLRR